MAYIWRFLAVTYQGNPIILRSILLVKPFLQVFSQVIRRQRCMPANSGMQVRSHFTSRASALNAAASSARPAWSASCGCGGLDCWAPRAWIRNSFSRCSASRLLSPSARARRRCSERSCALLSCSACAASMRRSASSSVEGPACARRCCSPYWEIGGTEAGAAVEAPTAAGTRQRRFRTATLRPACEALLPFA
jgi:hypothetical protein